MSLLVGTDSSVTVFLVRLFRSGSIFLLVFGGWRFGFGSCLNRSYFVRYRGNFCFGNGLFRSWSFFRSNRFRSNIGGRRFFRSYGLNGSNFFGRSNLGDGYLNGGRCFNSSDLSGCCHLGGHLNRCFGSGSCVNVGGWRFGFGDCLNRSRFFNDRLFNAVFLDNRFGAGFIYLALSFQTGRTCLFFGLCFGVGGTGNAIQFVFFPGGKLLIGLLLRDGLLVYTHLQMLPVHDAFMRQHRAGGIGWLCTNHKPVNGPVRLQYDRRRVGVGVVRTDFLDKLTIAGRG